jgi:hypothetical protein
VVIPDIESKKSTLSISSVIIGFNPVKFLLNNETKLLTTFRKLTAAVAGFADVSAPSS